MEEVERIKAQGYWPSDVKYALITNGSLLTKDILEALQKYGIALSISYDVDKESHAQRVDKNGNNSYDLVRQKIALCHDLGAPFSLSITISETLLKRKDEILSEIFKHVAIDYCIQSFDTQQTKPEERTLLRGSNGFHDRSIQPFKKNRTL